ncbi:MAG: preprotein translocase subunit SecE [Candidatus Omnitrophica bacterium]|nr:preprotein translocase subunit SecE [Candidatus Omnitrophota bacterium]
MARLIMIEKMTRFLQEVPLEVKMVSWSTKNELIGSTMAVIILVVILAIFIGFCDVILSKMVDIVIRYSL